MTTEREKKKEIIREIVSERRKSILQDNIIQIQGRAFSDIMEICEMSQMVDSDAIGDIIFRAHLDILNLTK